MYLFLNVLLIWKGHEVDSQGRVYHATKNRKSFGEENYVKTHCSKFHTKIQRFFSLVRN